MFRLCVNRGKKGFRIICLFVLSVCFCVVVEDVEGGGWEEMEGAVVVLSFLSLICED